MLIDDLTQLPDSFKVGVRCLLLLHRPKDGSSETSPQRHSKKIITQNKDEWEKGILKLRHLQQTAHPDHRIYASVNARNMKKGIHEFKRRQLHADYDNEENHLGFYLDIENRLFSSIMTPGCRNESYFLVDCDTNEEYEEAKNKLKDLIVFDYPSRSGRHLITKPFNPNELKITIQKDGLLAIG